MGQTEPRQAFRQSRIAGEPLRESRHPDPIGLLWALAAAGLWGTLSPVSKWLLGHGAGPLPVVAVRATLAAAVLGLAMLLADRRRADPEAPRLLRISRRDLPFFALYGLVSVAGNYLTYIVAVQQVGAILAATMFYTYPAMAAVLAVVFLREPLGWRRALPLPITFLGCALAAGLFSGGDVPLRPAGVAAALVSAATFALYPLFGRRAMARYAPWTVLLGSIAFAALYLDLLWAGLCPLAPAAGQLCGGLPRLEGAGLPFWAGMLYLALGPTLVAYLSYLQAIRRLQVRQASLVTTLEFVVAFLLAYLLLAERPGAVQWIGVALIFGSVLWVRLESD